MCPWTRAPPAKTARWEDAATSSGKTHNPDNLGSAVSRAHRYEPDTNPTYHDLARHYGVAVLPARGEHVRCGACPICTVAVHPRLRGGDTPDISPEWCANGPSPRARMNRGRITSMGHPACRLRSRVRTWRCALNRSGRALLTPACAPAANDRGSAQDARERTQAAAPRIVREGTSAQRATELLTHHEPARQFGLDIAGRGEPCQVIELEVDTGIRGSVHYQIDQLQSGHLAAQSRDCEQFSASSENRFQGPAGP